MRWWVDGQVHTQPQVPFDLRDRGLLLSDGLFDTALVVGGKVAYGTAHLDRLQQGCATLGFDFDRETAETAWAAVSEGVEYGSVRLTVTRGSGPRGVLPPQEPRPVIFANGFAKAPGLAFTPMRLAATGIRRNESSPAAGVKTLGYLDAVLAAREAKGQGADEALFLNTQGRVACAGSGNLFALIGDRLITPPLSEGVLPGVIRARLLQLAAKAGLHTEEAPLFPGDLERAGALLVTNSLRLVSPVMALDAREMPPLPAAVARLAEALTEDLAADLGCDMAHLLNPESLRP